MIEIKIPSEIRKYKEKLFFGLTLRQTICVVIAIAVNVPLYIFSCKYIGYDLASWLVIILAVPIMAIGFFKYNGMTAEQFAIVIFLNTFLYPQKRKYKTENFYEVLLTKSVKEDNSVIKSFRNKKQKNN